jgi:hypothetical protein
LRAVKNGHTRVELAALEVDFAAARGFLAQLDPPATALARRRHLAQRAREFEAGVRDFLSIPYSWDLLPRLRG